jgi:hypothetical protein
LPFSPNLTRAPANSDCLARRFGYPSPAFGFRRFAAPLNFGH